MASMILFDTANHGTDSQFAVAWRVWGVFLKTPSEQRHSIKKKTWGGMGGIGGG